MKTKQKPKQKTKPSSTSKPNWRERLKALQASEEEQRETGEMVLDLDVCTRATEHARRLATEVRAYRIACQYSETDPDPVCEEYIKEFRSAFSRTADQL